MKMITAPLSKEDIKLLKSQNPTNYFAILSLSIIALLLVYHTFYEDPDFPKHKQEWEDVFIMILGGIFIGILLFSFVYIAIQNQKDIKSGQKEVLMGILTDKNSHYFYLDNEKIALKNISSRLRRYSNYHDNIGEIGQTVAIERTIYAKSILKVVVLKEIK